MSKLYQIVYIVCTVGYDVTITSANSIAVSLSHDTRDQYTAMLLAEVIVTSYPTVQTLFTIWYNFDTVLYQFLETGASDRCLICIVQNLRLAGFSLYPLSFFLYSPFKCPLCHQINLYPIHLLSDSSVIRSIRYPKHLLSDPYVIRSICYTLAEGFKSFLIKTLIWVRLHCTIAVSSKM